MVSSTTTRLLLPLGLVSAVAQAAGTQPVSVPSTKPSSAKSVPIDFVGFGFETAFLDTYNNAFSENLISSVASRMGTSPIIRIGGTTGDRIHINLGQSQAAVCVGGGGCPWSSSSAYILGPSYFDGFSSFTDARMTFQIPLGPTVNSTNIQDYARLAYQALGADRTVAIAIGNEVGGYDHTAQSYVTAALAAEKVVTDTLGLNGSAAQIFEVGDLASVQLGKQRAWTLADAYEAGLNSNGLVKLSAEHWYQGGGGAAGMQAVLMNHTAVLDKYKTYAGDVAYSEAHSIPFAMSETGDILGDTNALGPFFGGALWAVDYQMFCASQGIARVDGSQHPQAPHSLWIPVAGVPNEPGPQVRAPFYAEPFMADFVGKTDSASVINIDLNSAFMSAYAVYEGSSLARVGLVNLNEWGTSGEPSGTSEPSATARRRSTGSSAAASARPTETFAVSVPSGVSSVQVARLHADDGAFAGGYDYNNQTITYAGMQWSYTLDQGKGHGTESFDTVSVQNGVANVPVPASEAVIVYVQPPSSSQGSSISESPSGQPTTQR